MKLALVVIAIAVTLGLAPTNAQAQEPHLIAGTWVLNQAASSCGGPCPRRMVRTYEDLRDGRVRASFNGVSDRGDLIHQSYTAKHDGKEYRYRWTGTEGLRTIEFTRVDAYSSIWVVRRDGVEIQTGTSTVSMGGQTYTQASGPSVQVFDRRPQ